MHNMHNMSVTKNILLQKPATTGRQPVGFVKWQDHVNDFEIMIWNHVSDSGA